MTVSVPSLAMFLYRYMVSAISEEWRHIRHDLVWSRVNAELNTAAFFSPSSVKVIYLATIKKHVPRVHVPMLSDPEGLDRIFDPEGVER